ncbi:hypothetical protein Nmel_007590, partial [Mimus melanotis]
FLPSFFLPSQNPSFLESFLESFLPGILPGIIPGILPSWNPSFLESFLPSWNPSFLLSLCYPHYIFKSCFIHHYIAARDSLLDPMLPTTWISFVTLLSPVSVKSYIP